jgi:hypothetical protein
LTGPMGEAVASSRRSRTPWWTRSPGKAQPFKRRRPGRASSPSTANGWIRSQSFTTSLAAPDRIEELRRLCRAGGAEWLAWGPGDGDRARQLPRTATRSWRGPVWVVGRACAPTCPVRPLSGSTQSGPPPIGSCALPIPCRSGFVVPLPRKSGELRRFAGSEVSASRPSPLRHISILGSWTPSSSLGICRSENTV